MIRKARIEDVRSIHSLLQHYADKKLLPHKIWSDCINCTMFPDCDEEALMYEVAVFTE